MQPHLPGNFLSLWYKEFSMQPRLLGNLSLLVLQSSTSSPTKATYVAPYQVQQKAQTFYTQQRSRTY